ncbi:MAG TPA: glycosyltransferase [Methanoregula sp.]|nr:glycosyltransferase [Methanoregula sp.]
MTPPDPVVSVIIPTYNQADLLRDALQSVLSQTFPGWEAIVIDNFSPDRTRETVLSLPDPRIRYVQFSNNGIIAASRNHGIFLARGKYVAFLDSDDRWYPEKLSRSLAELSGGAGAVCHGMRICETGKSPVEFRPLQPVHDFYETLLFTGNSLITTSTVVVKREWLARLGGFSENPAIVTAEDYDLWLRLLNNGVRFTVIPEILGDYSIHGLNESKNIERQMNAEEWVFLMHCGDKSALSWPARMRVKKSRMMIAFRAGKRALDAGLHTAAAAYAWKGVAVMFR